MKHGTRLRTVVPPQLLSRRAQALLAYAVAFLSVCFTSQALASTVVVVPPHVKKGTPSELVESALDEITRLVRAHGFDTVSPGQAEAAAEDAQKSGGFPADINLNECTSSECASEYRKLFDAAFAVQLSFTTEGRKVSTVAVVITEDSKAYFSGSAPLQADDIRTAVQTAYAAARDLHLRGAGPWLNISGSPKDAVVFIDGVEFGTLPITKRHIESGMHRLEVRRDGFLTHKQELNIPARVDHEQNLRVELVEVRNAQAGSGPALNRTWDYVLGGVIAAVGAVHVGAGIYQRTQRDECAERSGNVCVERYGDDTGVKRDNLLIGTGIASIAVGGLVMGLAPIARLQLRAGRDSASVHVGGSF